LNWPALKQGGGRGTASQPRGRQSNRRGRKRLRGKDLAGLASRRVRLHKGDRLLWALGKAPKSPTGEEVLWGGKSLVMSDGPKGGRRVRGLRAGMRRWTTRGVKASRCRGGGIPENGQKEEGKKKNVVREYENREKCRRVKGVNVRSSDCHSTCRKSSSPNRDKAMGALGKRALQKTQAESSRRAASGHSRPAGREGGTYEGNGEERLTYRGKSLI